MRNKRSDKNSASAAVAGFAGAISGVPLPEGVELRSDEEQVIWDQFTRARAREDWRDLDLILLAKIVRMEADIRQYQTEIQEQGAIVKNQRGTQIPNPLLSIIDKIERRQLAVVRSMSLNQQHADPRTLNGAAKTQQNARDTLQSLPDDGLIAIPKH